MKSQRQGRTAEQVEVFIYVWAVILSVLLSSTIPAAERQQDSSASGRYRVFSLRQIPGEVGKEYLTRLGIGTVSQLADSNTLLVTGKALELQKATAILRLADSNQPYLVRQPFAAPAVENLPSSKEIGNHLGEIEIGTFADPPTVSQFPGAIVDIHDNQTFVLAPADRAEKIVDYLRQYRKADKQTQQLSEPNQPQPRQTEPTEQIEVKDVNEAVDVNELKPVVELPPPKISDSLQKAGKMAAAGETAAAAPDQPDLVQEPISGEQAKESALAAQVDQQPVTAAPEQPPAQPEGERGQGPAEVQVLSYPQPAITGGDDMLELDLPEVLEIGDLLRLVGEYLGLDYMYDAEKVKGSVTLKLRGPIKVKDLYPLLESVLKFKNFAMTRKGNLVTIVPAEDALKIDPAFHIAADQTDVGDVIITRVFNLRHIDADSAKNLLEAMKLGADINTSISRNGTLIVTGYTYRMPRIEQLLEMIDKPGKPREFRFRQLKYTMAENLAPKIEKLAEQLGTVEITVAKPTPEKKDDRRPQRPQRPEPKKPSAKEEEPAVYIDADERTNRILMVGLAEKLDTVEELIDSLDVEQQDLRTLRLYEIQYVGAEEVSDKLVQLGIISEQRETRLTTTSRRTPETKSKAPAAGTAEEPLAEKPQVVVVESTNSLLVNATAEQHAKIAMIIGYVDSETLQAEIPYKIYPLENQDPEHLADIFTELIEETKPQGAGKEAKIEKPEKLKKEERITIVPDPNTFSLIVYASKKNQKWIGNLIETLDKRRPQVLIDVTLVQVSKNDAFNYDLNIISSFPDLTDTSGLTGSIMGGPNDTNTNLVSALTGSNRDRFIDLQAAGGSGIGFYADRHINALLTAMQQKNYGRVLAKPKILVNDNQPGIIKTTDTTYVKKTGAAVVEGVAGTVQTSVEYDPYDAGITLDITPHISIGNLLRLEIKLSRSDFGNITGEKPPDTTSSDLDTVVTVPDGSTIILGGLLKLNQTKGGSKVPLLGDIPLLGGLFRSTGNSDIQRKLYIFVKAEIIRPEETAFAKEGDLERISARNREAFEKHEKQFQKYEDWPGITPQAMEPEKVLDAQ